MLQDKLREDIQKALKQNDSLRLSVLRMLSSALHNRGIEKRARFISGSAERARTSETILTDEESIVVVRSEVKKRHDAIREFTKGGRQDLVEKESRELQILEEYSPSELGEEAVKKMVQEVITSLDEASRKEFGRVMGETMKRLKGQAGGDRVSQVVKKILGYEDK